LLPALSELRAAVLARQHAKAKLHVVCPEREIPAGRATERDPRQPLQ